MAARGAVGCSWAAAAVAAGPLQPAGVTINPLSHTRGMENGDHRRLRVLFVCAMNKQRSVTAERIYRNDARLEVRSAGVRAGASRRVSEADLLWADIVYVMESDQKAWITSEFRHLDLPRLDVLGIPDEFDVMDPELVTMLRWMLDPELNHLTSPGDAAG